jgi:hypothetical protein
MKPGSEVKRPATGLRCTERWTNEGDDLGTRALPPALFSPPPWSGQKGPGARVEIARDDDGGWKLPNVAVKTSAHNPYDFENL